MNVMFTSVGGGAGGRREGEGEGRMTKSELREGSGVGESLGLRDGTISG